MKFFRICVIISTLFGLILIYGCMDSSQSPSSSTTLPTVSVENTPEPSIAESSSSITIFLPESSPPVTSTSQEPSPEVSPKNNIYSYDVIIYGGTPAGVMAATEAAREGLTVAIIEPGKHLGGMISSGLGFSDAGKKEIIGGLAKEFFIRTGILYFYQGNDYAPQYYVEPHMAEDVFSWFLAETGPDVFYEHRLKEIGGVQKSGLTIESITTENQAVFYAKVFIDCSYEGDLMAMSGISYTVGREGQSEYGETLAGVRPRGTTNNFIYNLSAYSSDGQLFAGISNEALTELGTGDQKLPAYNFRLCLTKQVNNRVTFEKPVSYDPSQYELLLQWIYLLKRSENNRDIYITDVFSMGNLLGDKTDANNLGPFSSDYIGHSWDYPEADYETRNKIIEQHKLYLQGLLYFLANDDNVPVELREDVSKWGLAKDEFIDNDNWPYQLYIREARRMVGDFILTQKDLQTDREKTDSVGMGSYAIDSHHIQRVVTEDGHVYNEGELQVSVLPYQLPYSIITPKMNEADNLLVPVCVSASHVAYSSMRMEVQFMMLGQAAGLAAKLSIVQKCAVQDIDINILQDLLERKAAVLSLQ